MKNGKYALSGNLIRPVPVLAVEVQDAEDRVCALFSVCLF